MSRDINKSENTRIQKIYERNNDIFKDQALNFSGESYGEIYISGNEKGDPYWWINCDCQKKFFSIEQFLNHVSVTHYATHQNQEIYVETDEHFNGFTTESQNEFEISKTNDDIAIQCSDLKEELFACSTETESIEVLGNTFCAKCNKFFDKEIDYERHITSHLQNKENYECKICGEEFPKDQKQIWRSHKQRAHSDKHACNICGKNYASKFSLNEHMQTHIGSEDFKCNSCSKCFYTKSRLSSHIRKRHCDKVPCKFCQKLFLPGNPLQIHERIHTGEKPYVCEQCGSTFQRLNLLRDHIKRHNNDRRYECDICGKKFFNSTYLRDHKIIHTNEKPYQCQICDARFNSRPALIKHKNLHSSIKRYVCKICGKAYAQRPGLYAHTKTHNEFQSINSNLVS